MERTGLPVWSSWASAWPIFANCSVSSRARRASRSCCCVAMVPSSCDCRSGSTMPATGSSLAHLWTSRCALGRPQPSHRIRSTVSSAASPSTPSAPTRWRSLSVCPLPAHPRTLRSGGWSQPSAPSDWQRCCWPSSNGRGGIVSCGVGPAAADMHRRPPGRRPSGGDRDGPASACLGMRILHGAPFQATEPAPCTPSASTAASRSATNRTAATTAITPTSRPPPRSARARRSRWRRATRSTARSRPATTVADFAALDAGKVHPLTGPVFVKGAQPGDILEIEFTDIIPQPTAFSAIMPGLGFLRDVMTEPFLVHWQLKDNWATSAQLPGVRIPGAPFMGVSAVAPTARTARRLDRARAARDRRAAASRCRPMPPARCPPDPAASPACAPCRRARTAAIST